MKKVLLVVIMLSFMVSIGFAKDITIVGVPDAISEAQIKEWVSIYVERQENKKLQPAEELVTNAQTVVDTFRKANDLDAKYEAKEVVE